MKKKSEQLSAPTPSTSAHGKYKPHGRKPVEATTGKNLTAADIEATMTEVEKAEFTPGLLDGQMRYIETLLGW